MPQKSTTSPRATATKNRRQAGSANSTSRRGSFGAGAPSQDAEIIALANEVFNYLGVSNLSLEINSIGCKKCRAEYHKALKEYFASHIDELCDTCRGRLEKKSDENT